MIIETQSSRIARQISKAAKRPLLQPASQAPAKKTPVIEIIKGVLMIGGVAFVLSLLYHIGVAVGF